MQFILRHVGTITVNHEYTVNLQANQALEIDWFANNDIIISTANQNMHFNAQNTTQIAPNTYLIEIPSTTDLNDLPVKFERYPYLVAGDILINENEKTYLTADQIDIMPDEIVAAHGEKVTRILFSGNKTATEHYQKKPSPSS